MRGLGLGLASRRFSASGYGDDFVFTVETTGASESFTIPCQDIGTFNAIIDWDDGSISSITAYDDADLAHTYSDAGIHTIRVRGSFPNIYFNNDGDGAKVISVIQLGKVGWATLSGSFFGCSGLTSFTAGVCDTSAVEDLSDFLRLCVNLPSISLSGMNTSNISVLSNAFRNMNLLEALDLSVIDTSNVTTISNMCRGNVMMASLNVAGIDTSLLQNFQEGFYNCQLLNADLSSLNFSSASNLTNFLWNCDAMSAANLDLLLASIYAQRASITWETPALDISTLTNDPTGVYQDATPPTTGLEYVYKLVNDPDAEGFNVWTITY